MGFFFLQNPVKVMLKWWHLKVLQVCFITPKKWRAEECDKDFQFAYILCHAIHTTCCATTVLQILVNIRDKLLNFHNPLSISTPFWTRSSAHFSEMLCHIVTLLWLSRFFDLLPSQSLLCLGASRCSLSPPPTPTLCLHLSLFLSCLYHIY